MCLDSVRRQGMITSELIVVWLNNRRTLWRWDNAAEEYCYLRDMTEREGSPSDYRQVPAPLLNADRPENKGSVCVQRTAKENADGTDEGCEGPFPCVHDLAEKTGHIHRSLSPNRRRGFPQVGDCGFGRPQMDPRVVRDRVCV